MWAVCASPSFILLSSQHCPYSSTKVSRNAVQQIRSWIYCAFRNILVVMNEDDEVFKTAAPHVQAFINLKHETRNLCASVVR